MENRPGKILIDVVDERPLGDLTALGHPVMVCHGPHEGAPCPLLEDGKCSLSESADGVVFALDMDKPEHRKILETYRSHLREDVPIAVALKSPDQAERYADEVKGLRVWMHEPAVGDLDALAAEVEAVERTT